jgi:hypothetical protein
MDPVEKKTVQVARALLSNGRVDGCTSPTRRFKSGYIKAKGAHLAHHHSAWAHIIMCSIAQAVFQDSWFDLATSKTANITSRTR